MATETTTETTITIIAPTETLYARLRGQHRAQPVEVRLDCEARTLTAGVDWASPAVSCAQWHGLTLAWTIPSLTQSAAEALLEAIREDAEEVLAGFERRWDGSNHVGRFDDDARDAIQRIATRCEREQWDESETLEVWDGWDWLCAGMREEQACRVHGVTADTTDEELSALEDRLLEDAGAAVIEDLERALHLLRDGARIRASEEEEERADEEEAAQSLALDLVLADLDGLDAAERERVIRETARGSESHSACEWSLEDVEEQFGVSAARADRARELYPQVFRAHCEEEEALAADERAEEEADAAEERAAEERGAAELERWVSSGFAPDVAGE